MVFLWMQNILRCGRKQLYAVICVVIVSWRSHRYAALLFLASDYISNNYFYVSERGGALAESLRCLHLDS